jgi:hypothetical protein
MLFTNSLGVVLHRSTPNLSVLEILNQGLVKFATEGLNLGITTRQNDWLLIVRNLALGFGVNSEQIEVLPNLGHQLIKVPLVLGRDRHVVRHSVVDAKLFD